MKVAQVMTPAPLACGPETNLGEIAALMRDANCSIVPVVDLLGRVVGVVTDRDICMAATARHAAPSEIMAKQLSPRAAVCCRPEDDVTAALELMKTHRVRRLPVTSESGALHGIVSIDDILLETGAWGAGFTSKDILSTLQAVCARQLPVAARAAHTA